MLHNFMRQSSYADVFAGCGVAVGGAAGVLAADGFSLGKLPSLCYLRNDHSTPFSGTIIVSLVALSNGKTTKLAEISAEVGGGGGASALFCPTGGRLLGTTANQTAVCGSYASVLAVAGCKPTTCYLDISITSAEHAGKTDGYSEESTGVLYAHNEQLLAAPFQLQLPRINLSVHVPESTASAEDGAVNVEVQADTGGVAAYVWLSTLAAGRFAPNGFMMNNRSKIVKFIPFETVLPQVRHEVAEETLRLLRQSTRVEHLGEHL